MNEDVKFFAQRLGVVDKGGKLDIFGMVFDAGNCRLVGFQLLGDLYLGHAGIESGLFEHDADAEIPVPFVIAFGKAGAGGFLFVDEHLQFINVPVVSHSLFFSVRPARSPAPESFVISWKSRWSIRQGFLHA